MPICQTQASITLQLMAILHLIFYVPLVCLRVAALFVNGSAPETAFTLLGATFLSYSAQGDYFANCMVILT